MSSITLIISVSVIILLIYAIFSLLMRKPYSGSIANANKPFQVTVKANSTPATSYSIWIYISEWNVGQKVIFNRPGFIKLSLAENTNKLELELTGSTNKQDISYTKYPQYYYPYTTTYYYGIDDTCQMVCNGMTGCSGYNFYKKYPGSTSVGTNSTYRTSYTTTEGCNMIVGSTTYKNELLVSNFPGSYVKIKDIPTSRFTIDTFIPLQEWVYITINMDTHYTQIYINGKMIRTIINTNEIHTGTTVNLSPASDGGTTGTTGEGFTGYTAKFTTTNKSLTTQEIWNNYKDGFGYYLSLSDYSVKVSLYKD